MEENRMEVRKKNGVNIKDIIYIILYFIALELVLGIPIAALMIMSKISTSTGLFLISNIKFVILVILGIIWYKNDIKEYYNKFKANWKKLLGMIILLLFTGLVADTIISLLIAVPEPANQKAVNEMFNNFPIVESISIVLFAPFIEEIIFRYILIGKLSNVINIKLAAIISCIFFAFIHSGFTISILSYSIISVCLTLVYIKSDNNLIASMIFHVLWNLTALLMMIFI